MRSHFFLTFFIIYSLGCSAQSTSYELHPIDTELEECQMLSENQTTSNMIVCEYNARIAWDKEMNKYFNLLMETLKPTAKKLLKESQRSWLQYRDNEMSFAGSLYKNMDGTSWLLIHARRLTAIVKQRALELEEYHEMATFDPD